MPIILQSFKYVVLYNGCLSNKHTENKNNEKRCVRVWQHKQLNQNDDHKAEKQKRGNGGELPTREIAGCMFRKCGMKVALKDADKRRVCGYAARTGRSPPTVTA